MIGGGVAGLAAAASAAAEGVRAPRRRRRPRRARRRPGDADGDHRLAAEARDAGVRVLEEHAAIGVYEGPSAALLGPEGLVEVEAERVIVATGALEAHGVFPGNDLPGVWLGRGAARMAATQGVRVGERAVVVANTSEGDRDRRGHPRGRQPGHAGRRPRPGSTRPQAGELRHGAHPRGPPCLRMRCTGALARLGAPRHPPSDELPIPRSSVPATSFCRDARSRTPNVRTRRGPG